MTAHLFNRMHRIFDLSCTSCASYKVPQDRAEPSITTVNQMPQLNATPRPSTRALTITPVEGKNVAPVSYELQGEATEIGSATENDIVLSAPEIAPHHFAVRRIEGRDYLMVNLAARWRQKDWAWFHIRAGDLVWCPRHGSIKTPRRRGRCPQCHTRRGSLWLLRPLDHGDTFDIGRSFRARYVTQLLASPRPRVSTETLPAERPAHKLSITLSMPPLLEGTAPADDSNLWRWQPEGVPFPIFLHQRVNRLITAHAQQNRAREVGGLLLGDARQDEQGRMYVVVTHALRAEFAQETRGHLTFTQKTWLQLHHTRDQQYPDKMIVGWYHTHPGWTIFLSQWDLFIHQNFFREPWQIALVIDPSFDRAGIFVWQNGLIVNPQQPLAPFRLAELDGWPEGPRPRIRIKLKEPV